MSIDYTVTQHGTIQIECGDDWIEGPASERQP